MPETAQTQLAFDLRQAVGNPTGVGRYLLGLANAAALAGIPVRAYVRTDAPGGLERAVDVAAFPVVGPWWHLRVWRDLRARPATWISTSLIVSQLPGVRALPAVLDLTTVLFPEYHTRRTRLAERLLLPRALRRWPVLTCTAATAADLARCFGPRIISSVVPPALPEPIVARSPAADPPYVLHVGTLEPRKNIWTALRAVRRIREQGGAIRLVVVGKPGWRTDELERELQRATAEGAAEVLGYVTDAERDRLYAEALAVVVPSVYEGFGLPLLEAMARGIPSICSDAPALVEVSGGAAIHVPTFDDTAWADAIAGLVGDDSARADRGERGLRRAAMYGDGQAVAGLRQAVEVLADWVAGRRPSSA